MASCTITVTRTALKAHTTSQALCESASCVRVMDKLKMTLKLRTTPKDCPLVRSHRNMMPIGTSTARAPRVMSVL